RGGIRVVDLTSYIAGAYAAMQLADMGADVVKVESPEGDPFRELPGFFGWNRGKRSISLDLKTPEGREIVERLAVRGDVVMENMRPGVADRLGVGWERLAALNPRLVYCSVTAFGSTGPGVERPGFDPIFQALGGVMTLQGFGGPPQYLRADRLLHGGAGDPGHPRGALRARAHRARPARRDLTAPRRPGAPVGRRRGLPRQARADPRQPDLPSLPDGRWPVVLPRGRQPVLLGQALQGARSRAPRRRSALRLLDAAPSEQPGSPADFR